jgi:hypothetical protein
MNFGLTEEQRMARDTVREFARNEIAPVAREFDEAEKFPHTQIKGLAELGLLGMIIPEEYGGAGFDSVSYALALEEISKADASVAVIVSVTNSVCCQVIMTRTAKRTRLPSDLPMEPGMFYGVLRACRFTSNLVSAQTSPYQAILTATVNQILRFIVRRKESGICSIQKTTRSTFLSSGRRKILRFPLIMTEMVKLT